MGNTLFIINLFLAIAYAIFLFWCIYGWAKTDNYPAGTALDRSLVSISVIIPARNEEDHMRQSLEDFIHQDYPRDSFELLVVDDHSSDRTAAIAEQFISQNPAIRIRLLKMIDSEKMNLFKKHAITEAIAVSSGELIITTDADCRRGPKWLSTLALFYRETGSEMISAPVIFENEKGWFEKIQSLEFLGLIAIGAAAIKNNMPFLCNGANLAFKRSSFIDAGGYRSAKDIATGDDTQLMQKIAQANQKAGKPAMGKSPIQFVKSHEATVSTAAQNSVSSLLQQRRRWASKIPVQMSTFTISIAILAYLLHAGLLVSGLLVFLSGKLSFFLIPFFIKIIPEFILLHGVSSFFNKKRLLLLFLPAQIIYPLYISIVGLASMTGNYQWKGRQVK